MNNIVAVSIRQVIQPIANRARSGFTLPLIYLWSTRLKEPSVLISEGSAYDLESAKLAAVEAWRRWAREQAEAAGWEVSGE